MKSKNQRFFGPENESHFLKKMFKVKGMHCPSCEMLLKDSLGEADGVKNAEASYAKGTVNVEFDETMISEHRIRDIIKKEGYEVSK